MGMGIETVLIAIFNTKCCHAAYSKSDMVSIIFFFTHLPSVLVSSPSTSKIASLNSSLSLWISCRRTPFLLRMSSSSERSSGLRSTGTVCKEKNDCYCRYLSKKEPIVSKHIVADSLIVANIKYIVNTFSLHVGKMTVSTYTFKLSWWLMWHDILNKFYHENVRDIWGFKNFCLKD